MRASGWDSRQLFERHPDRDLLALPRGLSRSGALHGANVPRASVKTADPSPAFDEAASIRGAIRESTSERFGWAALAG
jgi:hypothetical protein